MSYSRLTRIVRNSTIWRKHECPVLSYVTECPAEQAIADWRFCYLQMQDIALCQDSNKVISPVYFGIILLLLVHSPSGDFLRKNLNSKVVKI
ncbi:hypothetical protein SAMN05421881_102124 [Nitrosomonas halophila]|uniref:Uncharacterized protein n=1 Tax=Nitrosomonas halophila TaxID=44576 RepID=A0A1H3HQ76_9PROT|nr:hypothetical protein SAMN05421881_102124 [Nitrosomonas halophila]